MASSGYGESTSSMPFENPSCSSNSGNGDAGDFECNICFDLAQDPIVTLCGHLFCWPCLYKWLHFHSQSQECPLCKALIQEEKLVPLYGRGKNSTDPRAMSIPSVDIPNRPAGQRPETARPPENNPFHQHGFGFVGGWSGIPPVASARFTNFALSASFIGLIPSLFNFNMHGYPDASMYGPGAGYHQYAHPGLFHGTYSHAHHYRHSGRGQQDSYLKMLFLIVAVLVLLTLITA